MNDLADLKNPEMINQQLTEIGIDSLDKCRNRRHFQSYPHSVHYSFNSRGFRDPEWPEDLTTAVWCIGDSFTVGLGSPLAHVWTQVLAQHSQRRTINISMNGASNQWIHRRALQIIRAVRPHNMVIMWSYLHRREHSNTKLSDEQRRIFAERTTTAEDLQMLCDQIAELNATGVNILHTAVPNFDSGEITIPPELNILHVKNLDLARDGFHFDILTSSWLAGQLAPRLL